MRFQNLVFTFLLSGIMTLIVSGITTLQNLGLDDATIGKWLGAYFSAWPVSFPPLLIVVPLVRRLMNRLVASEPAVS